MPGDLPGNVGAVPGLARAAEDDLIHRVGGDAGSLQRGPCGDRAQMGRRDVLQRAAERPNGRPDGGENDHILNIHPFLRLNPKNRRISIR